MGSSSLWGTLRQSNRANAAAVRAAEAASEANRIMREEQRSWLKFNPVVGSRLTYEAGSNSLMLIMLPNIENMSDRPAPDLAIEAETQIIFGEDRTGISSTDFVEARKRVAAKALKQSNERKLTETVFGRQPASMITNWASHAKVGNIPPSTPIALVVCVAIAYRTPGGHGGGVWSGVVKPIGGGMFANYIADAQAGPMQVEVFGEPPKYF